MTEIQYQNRILLRKMLQIDLKPGKGVVTKAPDKLESNPNGLNSYASLNRAVRIKEIARVADDNRNILSRLQNTRSHYSTERWQKDFDHNRRIVGQISENGDRFCKNPYFLHSVCTQENSRGPASTTMPCKYLPSAEGSQPDLSVRTAARSKSKAASRHRSAKSNRQGGFMTQADTISGTYYSNIAGGRPFSAPRAAKKRAGSTARQRPSHHRALSGRTRGAMEAEADQAQYEALLA